MASTSENPVPMLTSMLSELLSMVMLTMDPSGVVVPRSVLMETISLPMVMSTEVAAILSVLVVTLVPLVLTEATRMMDKVDKNSLVVSLLVDQPTESVPTPVFLVISETMMLEL